MDWLSSNWLVDNKMKANRIGKELPVLVNIWSYGLHIISGAIGEGLSKSSWPLKKVMKSLFTLFHHSLLPINESKVFAPAR